MLLTSSPTFWMNLKLRSLKRWRWGTLKISWLPVMFNEGEFAIRIPYPDVVVVHEQGSINNNTVVECYEICATTKHPSHCKLEPALVINDDSVFIYLSDRMQVAWLGFATPPAYISGAWATQKLLVECGTRCCGTIFDLVDHSIAFRNDVVRNSYDHITVGDWEKSYLCTKKFDNRTFYYKNQDVSGVNL